MLGTHLSVNFSADFIADVALPWWQSPSLFGPSIGALIAIGGVLINNWQARGRERDKMQHEAREAEKKRLLALKEKHYMAALAIIRTYGACIGRMADTSLENLVKVFGNDDLLATFSALELVAPIEVTLAGKDSAMYFAQNVQRLMVDRVDVQRIWDDFQAAQKAGNKSVQADAYKQFSEATGRLRARSMEVSTELQRKTIPFVIAMRKELGAPVDQEKYSAEISEGLSKIESGYNDFLSALKETLKL